MPHYKDGTPAELGDVVRGKGYNLKDKDGELREIVGTIIDVLPGVSSCNVRLLVTELHELPADYVVGKPHPFVPTNAYLLPGQSKYGQLVLEYGQADHFEKIEVAVAA